MNATDRGHIEEIITHLKKVETDYHINLTSEKEWLRGLAKKESVSEDLEEAIEQSFIDHENRGDDFRCDEQIETSYRYGFETGANWQKKKDDHAIEIAHMAGEEEGKNLLKQQMLQNAITATCFGFQGAALFSFRLPSDNYLVGSERKIVLIK